MYSSNERTRRALLGTGVVALLAGCPGISDVDGCTMTTDWTFESDAISQSSFGHTTNNVNRDGSCNRWGQKRCFEVDLWLDPEAVDRVEGRTPTGETVTAVDVDDQEAITMELAVVGYGETVERTVVVIADGEVIDQATVTLDCPERGAERI